MTEGAKLAAAPLIRANIFFSKMKRKAPLHSGAGLAS
jgi:hypothetical protein